MKELVLIRHGEAEHLVKNYTGGWSDTHLTPKGRIQAQDTAKYLFSLLNNVDFQIYSSDLSRALETAQIISSNFKKKSTIAEELRELSNGNAKNLTLEEAEKIYIPKTEPVMDWIPYPNGESWRMLCERVYKFMKSLNQKEYNRIIIVSHGNTIHAIINWWIEFNIDNSLKIAYDIDPCSITHLRINKWGEKTIAKLNQTLHLHPRLSHDSN